jgi:hypothetical protein
MTGTLLCKLVLLVGPALAGAPRVVVTIDETAGVPPGIGEEIRSALLSRISGMNATLVEIRVTPRSAEMRVNGKTESVAVTDWDGSAATRVVVLHAVDLATPLPDLPMIEVQALPAAAGRPRSPSIVLSLAPGLSWGLSSTDGVATGAELEVGIRRGRFQLGVRTRWSHGLERYEPTPAEASFDAWPVALLAGWSFGHLETVAGPFVGLQRLTQGATASIGEVTYGASAAIRWRGNGGVGWSWLAGVGLDCYARRLISDAFAPTAVYSTPRFAPSLTAGVSFGFPP